MQLAAVRDTTVQVNDMMQDVASTNAQQATAAGELSSRMSDVASQIAESHRHVEAASQVVARLASQSKHRAALAGNFEVTG